MIVMTFDLSSKCIGATFAQLDAKNITFAKTLAIIPEPITGLSVGYTTKEPKVLQKGTMRYKVFLKPDELIISQAEADRRLAAFDSLKHNELLRNIGFQCGKFLSKVNPDIVCIEKNKSFNGILTTKLLAEIAGGIYFYCGAHNIEMLDWDEATVRARIRRDITQFSYENKDGKTALDTKWEIHCRLRSYFEESYPGLIDFEHMTMDESDSLAVFYYWYVTECVPF